MLAAVGVCVRGEGAMRCVSLNEIRYVVVVALRENRRRGRLSGR